MNILIRLVLTFPVLLGAASADSLTLPAGTSIGAFTFVKLNTGKLKPGELVNLVLMFNVEIDGYVIVKAGTPRRATPINKLSSTTVFDSAGAQKWAHWVEGTAENFSKA